YGEVGDDAVLHGPYGFDIAGHPPQHLLGFPPHRLNDFLAARAAVVANGDDRRFIQHDTLAANVNEGIGGSEVDRHVGGKVATKESEHGRSVIKDKEEIRQPRQPTSATWAPKFDQRIKPAMITYNWLLISAKSSILFYVTALPASRRACLPHC